MRWFMLLTCWVLFFVSPAHAVELTGRIDGIVQDTDGLAVPGAVVELASPALMGARNTQTDVEGTFRFIALPPGDYEIAIVAPGFAPWKADARVSAGASIQVKAQLQVEEAGATIVVTGERPVVDTTNVQTGLTVTKEMLRDIPNAGRDYQTATSFAPGVVGGGNANMRGGADVNNQFFIDGVNITDPLTSGFSMNMNLDAIEEVQVITGGMDAEYGRALGGVVNVVTRDGGNDFEGNAQVIYTNSSMQLYKPLPEEEDVKDDIEYNDQQVAVNVGGPVVKDKLWYFAGLQMNRFVSSTAVPDEVGRPPGEEVMPARDWKSGYLFGKLSWRPSDQHSLWIHGQADPTDIRNSEQDPYALSDAEGWFQQGGWIASLGHEWTPDASTILMTQAYWQNSYIRFRPITWVDCESFTDYLCDDRDDGFYANDPDGFSQGEYPYSYLTRRQRQSLNSSVTRFFDFLGEHEAKAGFQLERLASYDIFPGLSGDGLEYWSHNGDPTDLDGYTPAELILYDTDLEAKLEGWLISAFIQDAWTIGGRLTLRPGLRLDTSRLVNDVGETVYTTANVAPRFGAAFDLTKDGKTAVHAYYGRFYDPGWLEVSGTLLGQSQGYSGYAWSEQLDDWDFENPLYSVSDTFLALDDLKTPFSDEFDLGITRDVGGGWSVDATFVYEELNNRFEDDEVNLIWNQDGTAVIGSRNGRNEAIYRLRTPEEVYSQYTSLEFSAVRQFTDKWSTMASYTWSRAYGFERSNNVALASGSMDIAPQWSREVGLQPYDVPHSVKLIGSYRDDTAWGLWGDNALGVLGGWNFRLHSGAPYGRLLYNEYYYDWSGYTESVDGTYRLPAISQLDLKGGLTFKTSWSKWDVTLECFNVFNDRTVYDVDTRYLDETGEQPLTDADGNLVWGTPLGRQAPRYFQVGLRGEF